jgi:F-type H+-transporting ATPase subunit delta
MRDTTIARNYAETLLSLAKKAKDLDGWGSMLQGVADAMRQDDTLKHFLESPRISAGQKNDVLLKALGDRTPRLFLRFLQILVTKRRQMLIPEISLEYQNLLDREYGRVHANVTVARDTSDAERAMIAKQLSRIVGKEVLAHVAVNPKILGGVIVKFGDTVMDGSVRRRLASLRARLSGQRG